MPKEFQFSVFQNFGYSSSLICLPGPSDGALRVSLALLYTYSLELLRCTNVVCSFSLFFANPIVGTCLIAFQLLPWAPKFPSHKGLFRSDDGVEN